MQEDNLDNLLKTIDEFGRKPVASLNISGKVYPVYTGINTLGRKRASTVNIKNVNVSQSHAVLIIIDQNTQYIGDLNSANGTILEGTQPLVPFKLYKLTQNTTIHFANVLASYSWGNTSNGTERIEMSQNYTQNFYQAATQIFADTQQNNSDSPPSNGLPPRTAEVFLHEMETEPTSIHDMATQKVNYDLHLADTQPLIFDRSSEKPEDETVPDRFKEHFSNEFKIEDIELINAVAGPSNAPDCVENLAEKSVLNSSQNVVDETVYDESRNLELDCDDESNDSFNCLQTSRSKQAKPMNLSSDETDIEDEVIPVKKLSSDDEVKPRKKSVKKLSSSEVLSDDSDTEIEEFQVKPRKLSDSQKEDQDLSSADSDIEVKPRRSTRKLSDSQKNEGQLESDSDTDIGEYKDETNKKTEELLDDSEIIPATPAVTNLNKLDTPEEDTFRLVLSESIPEPDQGSSEGSTTKFAFKKKTCELVDTSLSRILAPKDNAEQEASPTKQDISNQPIDVQNDTSSNNTEKPTVLNQRTFSPNSVKSIEEDFHNQPTQRIDSAPGDIFDHPSQKTVSPSSPIINLEDLHEDIIQPRTYSKRIQDGILSKDQMQHDDIFNQPTQCIQIEPSSNNVEEQNDIFDQPTQRTFIPNSVTTTKENNQPTQPLIDFDQPTQLINRECSQHDVQEDIYNQPTQRFNGLQEDPKSPSETLEEIFDQPTQLTVHSISSEENRPLTPIPDDIFDQPTQLTVEENHSLSPMPSTSTAIEDVYNVPSQQFINGASIDTEEDLFDEPTQRIVSSSSEQVTTTSPNSPSTEKRVELSVESPKKLSVVYSVETIFPSENIVLLPETEHNRPGNPVCQLLETKSEEHEAQSALANRKRQSSDEDEPSSPKKPKTLQQAGIEDLKTDKNVGRKRISTVKQPEIGSRRSKRLRSENLDDTDKVEVEEKTVRKSVRATAENTNEAAVEPKNCVRKSTRVTAEIKTVSNLEIDTSKTILRKSTRTRKNTDDGSDFEEKSPEKLKTAGRKSRKNQETPTAPAVSLSKPAATRVSRRLNSRNNNIDGDLEVSDNQRILETPTIPDETLTKSSPPSKPATTRGSKRLNLRNKTEEVVDSSEDQRNLETPTVPDETSNKTLTKLSLPKPATSRGSRRLNLRNKIDDLDSNEDLTVSSETLTKPSPSKPATRVSRRLNSRTNNIEDDQESYNKSPSNTSETFLESSSRGEMNQSIALFAAKIKKVKKNPSLDVLPKIKLNATKNRRSMVLTPFEPIAEKEQKTRGTKNLDVTTRGTKQDVTLSGASTSRIRGRTRGTKGSIESTASDSVENASLNESKTSPERSRRKQKPKVVFTMLDNPELESLIRQLGGSVVDSVDACTVLVTGTVKRSQKLLQAVGQAKPICGPKWLEECRKARQFLDPWEHILVDNEAESKWEFSLEESLKRSCEEKLLNDYVFQVMLINNNTVNVLKGAIEACGGKCVTKVPARTSEKFYVISTVENESKYKKIKNRNLTVINPEAIFDGVLRQELRFTTHIIHNN